MEQTLTLSPLQLRQLLFTRVRVEARYSAEEAPSHWAPSFDFSDTEIQLNVEMGERENDDPSVGHDYRMGVRLQLVPSESEDNGIPYLVDVEASAWLRFIDQSLAAAKRRSVVEVNGASMIIGAIRDEVARITARSALGTLTLPTLRIIPTER
ncbi:hypothetical protein [Thiohalocapsa marina]|uniref:hypothetical protein n=1 Tax=Thiohalocapsa marina TaxID=424902 RepID=UPI0036DF346B